MDIAEIFTAIGQFSKDNGIIATIIVLVLGVIGLISWLNFRNTKAITTSNSEAIKALADSSKAQSDSSQMVNGLFTKHIESMAGLAAAAAKTATESEKSNGILIEQNRLISAVKEGQEKLASAEMKCLYQAMKPADQPAADVPLGTEKVKKPKR
jgi:predicted negative regulator of RcsB-dependent stress response